MWLPNLKALNNSRRADMLLKSPPQYIYGYARNSSSFIYSQGVFKHIKPEAVYIKIVMTNEWRINFVSLIVPMKFNTFIPAN